MALWTDHVLPRIIDATLDSGDLPATRRRVCEGLSGDVVEIGFGSGLNVPHYPAGVRSVSAVEPSDVAWRLAQRRLDAVVDTGPRIVRSGLDGQRLDLPDDSFDAALTTFTLCTIPDVDTALRELVRVLRPGGQVHFLEHGRSPDAGVARWQNRLQPIQKRVAGGCHLNRPIAELFARNGYDVEHLENYYEQGPKPLAYVYLGRARVPATH